MPDLVTHVSIAYFLYKWFHKGYLELFLLGTTFPDLFTRPLFKIFPNSYWFWWPLHSLSGIVLICYLFSQFFIENERKQIFIVVLSGASLHIILDLLQKTTNVVGYAWLAPFNYDLDGDLGLFWGDQSLYIVPIWAIIFIIIGIRKLLSLRQP